jgi:hypothetical protein
MMVDENGQLIFEQILNYQRVNPASRKDTKFMILGGNR